MKKGESSHPLTLGCEKWISNTFIQFRKTNSQQTVDIFSHRKFVSKATLVTFPNVPAKGTFDVISRRGQIM